jgi:xanthine dehydrogenase accessory factor
MAWKELKQIIHEYQHSNGPFALATLVQASGSTYRHPGARMLVTQKGRYVGRLSAGCVEEEIAGHAQAVIGDGKPSLRSFDLRSRFACEGSIKVFVERLVKPNAFLEQLVRVIAERKTILVSTNYCLTDGAGPGTRLTDIWTAHHGEEFIQEMPPPIRLVIFGDYFDAESVSDLGNYLGWEVEVAMDVDQLPAGDTRTGCVVMSHHFGRDIVALKNVLRGGFGYVGLLGPRQRKQLLLNRLIDEGFPLENVSALHSPAGLDIGSETAEEIAMAIIAEVQAALTGRKGGSLRDRIEPIHKLRKPILCDELR